MLFRKKIERSCTYCRNGAILADGQVLCCRKGVVSVTEKCRKFKYDPCKRVPPRPKALDFEKYNEDDFSL